MFRCACGLGRCATTLVSRRTWFRHRMDQILQVHNNAATYDNNAPLPVEDAPPPDEDVEQEAPLADPEVHMFHICTNSVRIFCMQLEYPNNFPSINFLGFLLGFLPQWWNILTSSLLL
jgi:hypothetical protein